MKTSFVLFGATGDLSRKKLLPALARTRGVDSVIALGRRKLTTQGYISLMAAEGLPKSFLAKLKYVVHSLDKPLPNLGAGNMVVYLATPPGLFDRLTTLLQECGCLGSRGWKRIVYEKPFGYDLKSATELNRCIRKAFSEDQIYRIDHYLGKELVQSIIAFRFANSLLSEIWNTKHVESVQVELSEKGGVGKRAGYYEESGALRDMVQNHIMQLTSLVAMENPGALDAESIRKAKAAALGRMRIRRARFGQYTGGEIDNKLVLSYEDEVGRTSSTETFAELQAEIMTKRWKGVPFFLRTGKRMAGQFSEINLVLRDISCGMFCQKAMHPKPNRVTIRISPEEGLTLHLNAKVPGKGYLIRPVALEFCHACQFGPNTPDAYQMLISQVIAGDQTLFASWNEVAASWKAVLPCLGHKRLFYYRAGSSPGRYF